jgi:DNA polymerase-3 subunit alpha
MARQREKFRLGALKNGIDEKTSMHIFDKVEKFASYGFNKSHAAAYGYLTYVTAYLKANYPGEWMAALMTSDRDDITKVAKMIRECQAMGLSILPPDINESGTEFSATPRGIRFALTGIKGVGEGVVQAILEERRKNGAFKSLYEFFKRVDSRKVGKKAVEVLIEAGCFDFTGWSRQALMESVDPMYVSAAREQKEASRGVMNLFSLFEDGQEEKFSKPSQTLEKPSKQKILKRENELLGFYLTGHPMDEYRGLLERLSCLPLHRIGEMGHENIFRTAFIIDAVTVKISMKSQKKFAILTISDEGERFELPVWSDLYEEKGHLLTENQLIYAVIQVDKQGDEVKLHCKWFDDLTKVDEAMMQACDLAYDKAKMQVKMSFLRDKKTSEHKVQSGVKEIKNQILSTLHLQVDADEMRLSHVLQLKALFRSSPGKTPVKIKFCANHQLLASLSIEASWGIEFNEQIEQKIRQLKVVKSLHLKPELTR